MVDLRKLRGIDLPRVIGRESIEELPPELVRPLVHELEAVDQNLRELLTLIEDEQDLLAVRREGVDLPRTLRTQSFDGVPAGVREPVMRELGALDQNMRELLQRVRERFRGLAYRIVREASLTFSDTLAQAVVVPDIVNQALQSSLSVTASSVVRRSRRIVRLLPPLTFDDTLGLEEVPPFLRGLASTVDVSASSVVRRFVRIVRAPAALSFSDTLGLTEVPPATQALSSSVDVAASSVVRRSVRIVRTDSVDVSDALALTEVSPVTRAMQSTLSIDAESELRVTRRIVSAPDAFVFSDTLGVVEDDQTPAAPTGLSAQDGLSPGDVELSWSDNADNEDNYEVQRRLSPDGSFVTITSTLPANTELYTDDSSTCDVAYDYRVRATNSRGNSAFSNIVTFTPCEIA